MKKLSFILVLGLLLGATACGGEKETTSPATETEPSVVSIESTETTVPEETEVEEVIVSLPEDFEYEEENGELVITGYVGEATVWEIPASIDGMPVVAIGEEAFYLCNEVEKVTFPEGLREIRNGAFKLASLTSVTFPSTLTYIGESAFNLTDITELTIPPLLTEIPARAFYGVNIEKLVIPGSVKIVEKFAFENCDLLKTVVIEEGVEVLHNGSFNACSSLESVTLPSTLTEDTEVLAFWASGSEASPATVYVPANCVIKDELVEKYEINDTCKIEVIEAVEGEETETVETETVETVEDAETVSQ